MYRLRIIMFLLFPWGALAQPGITPTEVINGEKFYKHRVESGNTLWGLQRMYGVSMEQILLKNPSIKNGLKEGEDLFIPVTKESIAKIPVENYKVKRQETLYGISRKFKISIDDLIVLNPALKNGLKKGQVIKIPEQKKNTSIASVQDGNNAQVDSNPFFSDTLEKKDGSLEQLSITFSDSTIRHVVLPHETLYSISKRFMIPMEKIISINQLSSSALKEGQILTIPVKLERIKRVELKPVPENPKEEEVLAPLRFEKKSRYRVIMMLPFNLDDGVSKISNLATQFYMGAKMALDSLEKKGFNLDVHVLDSKSDSANVVELLKDSIVQSADLLIGPFYPKTITLVSEFCKKNRIRMVVPSSCSNEILRENRLIYQSVPSDEAMMELLAAHMSKKNVNDRIILIKPDKESDTLLYNAYKRAFIHDEENVFQSSLIESAIDDFGAHIEHGVNTLFVVPTNNRSTVMKFMSHLNRSAYKSKLSNLFVYGTKNWNGSRGISNSYKNKYNFRFATSNFLDYYATPVVQLNKLHRRKYHSDLSKMAAHGYDLMTFYCHAFFGDHENFYLSMSDFKIEQLSPRDGYMNKGMFLVGQKSYELFDCEKVHD